MSEEQYLRAIEHQLDHLEDCIISLKHSITQLTVYRSTGYVQTNPAKTSPD